ALLLPASGARAPPRRGAPRRPRRVGGGLALPRPAARAPPGFALPPHLPPRLGVSLARLAREAEAGGLPTPLLMQSSGGVIEAGRAAGHAASCVLSGPAGGGVGAAWVAGLSGEEDLLTFDMGGTSTDVAPVVGGRVQTTTEAVIAGVPLKLPMVDVHSVSAGGGSVAWVDEGGALRVGPASGGGGGGGGGGGRRGGG